MPESLHRRCVVAAAEPGGRGRAAGQRVPVPHSTASPVQRLERAKAQTARTAVLTPLASYRRNELAKKKGNGGGAEAMQH
ncbi:hypothetical protein NUW54_g9846 [Trametes sanguinea]|uniref:Uncharacterized protein n=1 Tax=Trametes sanguinea TaxID=158606 RepID=A0ACC1P3Y6_9APHY|nr:hypothetical protein NUW54_g9846 [Trametes sanguinea]